MPYLFIAAASCVTLALALPLAFRILPKRGLTRRRQVRALPPKEAPIDTGSEVAAG